MITHPPKLRLHNRLVFRFSLVMAITMLLFEQLSGTIHSVVFRAFGVSETMIIADVLGQGTSPPAFSAWRSANWLSPSADAFPALIDFEHTVISREVEGIPKSISELGLIRTKEAILVSPGEAQAMASRVRVIAAVTSWGTSLFVALLLGVGLSRLVTSRLGRLATAVAAFGASDENKNPIVRFSPLPDSLLKGRDEIGQLARTFVSSRERISALLDTLSLRDRTRREWIAHASHDLRTPMTALSACLERVDKMLAADKEPSREELQQVLGSARHDVVRLHELTDDLLSLARLEASDDFQPELLLAAELGQRAVTSLQQLARSGDIELKLDLGPGRTERLSFDGEGNAILRVLENLLRNAVQHATSTVTLRISYVEAAPGSPATESFARHDATPEAAQPRKDQDYVLFEVFDDGPGFQPPQLKADGSSGIGLRVATRFVELHGGRLETGDWENGARVAFSLPAG